ncbi:MAG: hypothetical protein AAF827_23075 [Cyanobacteria bacterium P01_D01_bin.6]
MQHTLRQETSEGYSPKTERSQEIDFELSEADLEEVVAGNPIVSFNKYFTLSNLELD